MTDWHLVSTDTRISPINWTQDAINPRNAVFSLCQFYVKLKHLNQDLRKNREKKNSFCFSLFQEFASDTRIWWLSKDAIHPTYPHSNPWRVSFDFPECGYILKISQISKFHRRARQMNNSREEFSSNKEGRRKIDWPKDYWSIRTQWWPKSEFWRE